MTDSTSRGHSGGLPVEQLDRGQREGRQRLVEREILLEVDRDLDPAPIGVRLGQLLHDARQPAVAR